MTHSDKRRIVGFTLLEVLVAIAIFAIFSAMAYGGLIRILESREHIDKERIFWRDISLVFTRLHDDLEQSRTRSVRDVYGNRLTPFRGQPTDTRALGEPSIEFTRGGVLMLGGGTRSDLQRVAYRLRDGILVRLYWPVLDRAPSTQPLEIPLLENVEEFSVRFYKDGGWSDQWPPLRNTDELPPQAVEIKLTHTQRGSFIRTFLVGDGG